MRTIRTPATRKRFLDALAELGNVRDVCRQLKLTRNAMYQWRAADPEFADDWDAALGLGTQALEDEARRRAIAGADRLLIFLLQSLRPEIYGRRSVEARRHRHDDYRDMSLPEMRKRLDALRRSQDRPSRVGDPDSV